MYKNSSNLIYNLFLTVLLTASIIGIEVIQKPNLDIQAATFTSSSTKEDTNQAEMNGQYDGSHGDSRSNNSKKSQAYKDAYNSAYDLAISTYEYNRGYDQGYQDGFDGKSPADITEQTIPYMGGYDLGYSNGSVESQRRRSDYNDGYQEGSSDKKNNNPNRGIIDTESMYWNNGYQNGFNNNNEHLVSDKVYRIIPKDSSSNPDKVLKVQKVIINNKEMYRSIDGKEYYQIDKYQEAYIQELPKNKKIIVISLKGINSYANDALTSKVNHYNLGTVLEVSFVITYPNGFTCLQLTDGTIITSNKNLISLDLNIDLGLLK